MGEFYKIIDLTNKRFGRLIVIKRIENYVTKSGRSVPMWYCKCDCGKFVKVRGDVLRRSNDKRSCGCLKKKETSKRLTKDLTGQRFGRLIVISRHGTKRGNATWLCKCDCGNDCIVNAHELIAHDTSSCGCIRKERNNNTKHGQRWTRLYGVWLGMKQRCNNSRCESYKYYGAKGVTVCEEWEKDFMTFHDWAMAHGYRGNLTIDRINPFGNYEPSNCRWITLSEQAYNKRDSKCNEKYKQEYEKNLDKFCMPVQKQAEH